jgi:integrase
VNTAWRNARKKLGIEGFHFHDTRHTWASLLIQNGVPKGTVKELDGWKSEKMIERVAHLAPELLAPHAVVLDRVLKAPGKTVELMTVPKRTP